MTGPRGRGRDWLAEETGRSESGVEAVSDSLSGGRRSSWACGENGTQAHWQETGGLLVQEGDYEGILYEGVLVLLLAAYLRGACACCAAVGRREAQRVRAVPSLGRQRVLYISPRIKI